MSQKTRKERQQELRAIEQRQEDLVSNVTIEKTDELIFKEQKQRLRKQLNDMPVISLDANDVIVKPNRLQTRKDIKKQKKIDNVLKDIAVLPEDKYLDEDTNLRILRNLSVHKQYNKLQLSPEQEEKMQENKERFDTITNQLWFLIQELDTNAVDEPGIGQVPTIASKDKKKIKNRFYDLEEDLAEPVTVPAKKKKSERVEPRQAQKAVPLNSERHVSEHIEEKLESMQLEENGELTMVLEELDRIIQDDKKIAQEELAKQQAEHMGNIPPQDTMELLGFLQELEDAKETLGAIDLTGTQGTIIDEANKIPLKKPVEATVSTAETKTEPLQKAPIVETKQAQTDLEKRAEQDSKSLETSYKTIDLTAPQLDAAEINAKDAEAEKQKIAAEKKEQLAAEQRAKVKAEQEAKNIAQQAEAQKKQAELEKTAAEQVLADMRVQEAEKQKKELEAKVSSALESEKTVEEPKEKNVSDEVLPTRRSVAKRAEHDKNDELQTKEEDAVEILDEKMKKKNNLQNSILMTSIIFIVLLIAIIIYVLYLFVSGNLKF